MCQDLTCPIDMTIIEHEITLPCKHFLCKPCWEKTPQTSCPLCRFEVPENWKPTPNKPLRAKLYRVIREAPCGKKLKLTQLRVHLARCYRCVKTELENSQSEKDAVQRRLQILETRFEKLRERIVLYRINRRR